MQWTELNLKDFHESQSEILIQKGKKKKKIEK